MTHIFASSDKRSALKFGPYAFSCQLDNGLMVPRHFNKIIFKRTPAAVSPLSILFNELRSHPAFSISADDISIYFLPWARNPAIIRYLRKS